MMHGSRQTTEFNRFRHLPNIFCYTMGLFLQFLNATVGLDTSPVTDLGYEVEPSPHLEGAFLVSNDPPPTRAQYVAVVVMTMTVAACLVKRSLQSGTIRVWILGLVSSYLHNVDNIFRPGTYFTPTWIVEPKFAFPMDQGFVLFELVSIAGVLALRTPQRRLARKGLIPLHSFGISLGIAHYVAQSPSRFSLVAHFSILFEFVMGIVVACVLLSRHDNRVVEETGDHRHAFSHDVTMELPRKSDASRYSVLRQRSKSPRI